MICGWKAKGYNFKINSTFLRQNFPYPELFNAHLSTRVYFQPLTF
ncbi:MAG: hypothetical protein AVDCRST_MAG95-1395 [uncultured Adhaeribacter sp.]|uniref:Uncharacterized protein n=1 Tax=uncultured Adhaeribacter sp. TaxID=448109 RepID=A0A6J4I1Z4_9BACT|nr:MAG: hypothetical protein AVDCRST_MAG95-1395 [uncultured Adhaeribacter sp.]